MAPLASCGGGGDGEPAPAATEVVPQACSINNPYRGDAESATTIAGLAKERV